MILTVLVVQCICLGLTLGAVHWTENDRERAIYKWLLLLLALADSVTLYAVVAQKT